MSSLIPLLSKFKSSIRNYSNFSIRHIGVDNKDIVKMLKVVKQKSLKDLVIKSTGIEHYTNIKLDNSISENKALTKLETIINKNKETKSLIGLGYHNSYLPYPIQRHILENPKWYTAYTPYQSEISQGRLESQYNFQHLIQDLTQLPISNASLLDEGSASAEVFNMCLSVNNKNKSNKDQFLVSDTLHPQTIEILKNKSKINKCTLKIVDFNNIDPEELNPNNIFGIMFQYPDTYGEIRIPKNIIDFGKSNKIPLSCSCDIMSLVKLISPGELGIDICFGTAQRFGVPMWFGGPHPAYLACTNEFIRYIPGRIINKGIDFNGNDAYRLALQTREQHIKKDKATSNICTSQSLLTNVVAMYSIYHGRDGLEQIYDKIHTNTKVLKKCLEMIYIDVISNTFFDTLVIDDLDSNKISRDLQDKGYLVRYIDKNRFSITMDETIQTTDIIDILNIIKKTIGNESCPGLFNKNNIYRYKETVFNVIPNNLIRNTYILEDDIFKKYRSETELMRYIYSLADKDYTLCNGMIPLGSCTMKLNSVSQLKELTNKKLTNVHPYSPKECVEGYLEIIKNVADLLQELTGMDATSFQSNSGSMGEYGGLLMIKKYLESKGELNRSICLIPKSAHGTNSASSRMANLEVVFYDDSSNDLSSFIDVVSKHSNNLAALMITYPGTNGIFTNNIKEICNIIHKNGGMVYMDGANMNAMTGILKPAELGADVCHLNLHKTFCIPHGGGGPGMGPILCTKELEPFLPNNLFQDTLSNNSIGMITSSLWSSASLLIIPYMYILCMGKEGLISASEIAILNSNYIKNSIENDYTIKDINSNSCVGHEFIIDTSEFKKIGVKDVDIAKRLIDYSFHPPTLSWPRPNVLMFEPTESESKAELDRLIIALKSIRNELREIENGEMDIDDNVIKNSPHTLSMITDWKYSYSMKKAFFPVNTLKSHKLWPSVTRVNDAQGDRELLTNR